MSIYQAMIYPFKKYYYEWNKNEVDKKFLFCLFYWKNYLQRSIDQAYKETRFLFNWSLLHQRTYTQPSET